MLPDTPRSPLGGGGGGAFRPKKQKTELSVRQRKSLGEA
jgi:hypothetical protein